MCTSFRAVSPYSPHYANLLLGVQPEHWTSSKNSTIHTQWQEFSNCFSQVVHRCIPTVFAWVQGNVSEYSLRIAYSELQPDFILHEFFYPKLCHLPSAPFFSPLFFLSFFFWKAKYSKTITFHQGLMWLLNELTNSRIECRVTVT